MCHCKYNIIRTANRFLMFAYDAVKCYKILVHILLKCLLVFLLGNKREGKFLWFHLMLFIAWNNDANDNNYPYNENNFYNPIKISKKREFIVIDSADGFHHPFSLLEYFYGKYFQ